MGLDLDPMDLEQIGLEAMELDPMDLDPGDLEAINLNPTELNPMDWSTFLLPPLTSVTRGGRGVLPYRCLAPHPTAGEQNS